jgi:drug/metabolite transporter (DMT)-like permease
MSARAKFTALDVGLYAGVVFAWGFSWIAIHYQVGTVPPEVSVMWRFALSAPIMLAIAAWRGERMRYTLAEHLRLVALGLALFCINFTLFYHGGLYLASGLLSVIFSLASVFNILIGAIFLRAPIDKRVALGATLGFLGIAAMFYPQLAGTQLNHGALIGLAFCVAGTLSFCTGNMISARLQMRGIPVFAASGYGMLYGTLALAIFCLLRGHSFAIEWTPAYLAGLAYLALIGSVMAFACYLTLLGRIGADRAAYSTVMFPVVALLVSTFVENYQWTIPAILGLLAVLAGNLLVLRAPKKS